ncbi:SRPBCC family protein [Heyndrickxia sp. MSNUG]|uniref:SRPBCC family protein n=1 Tax=Heyndrickxia sp. MSNUG TaxID=3136677 RepID=UPI003C2CBE22
MDTQITTKMKISKPAHEVYEAFVNPEKMANFWFSSGTGRMEPGKTIIWRYDEYNAEGSVHVLEVEENKKIVFSWGAENQETIVTITLKEMDDTSTVVEVSESGLRADDPEIVNKMIQQKEGWVYMLTCLKGYLENGMSNLRASLVH